MKTPLTEPNLGIRNGCCVGTVLILDAQSGGFEAALSLSGLFTKTADSDYSLAVKTQCCCTTCANGNPSFEVPQCLFNENGEVQKCFRNKDHDGFYCSPEGQFFCDRSHCYADYCE